MKNRGIAYLCLGISVSLLLRIARLMLPSKDRLRGAKRILSSPAPADKFDEWERKQLVLLLESRERRSRQNGSELRDDEFLQFAMHTASLKHRLSGFDLLLLLGKPDYVRFSGEHARLIYTFNTKPNGDCSVVMFAVDSGIMVGTGYNTFAIGFRRLVESNTF